MTHTEKKRSAAIIFLSLHGATRKAIDALSASLKDNGVSTDTYNLNEFKDNPAIDKLHAMIPSYPLVILGSPTYFHHAPPVFTSFVKNMPEAGDDQAAAILTTFGGVSSGVIQYDLAQILYDKNYRLMGGIKVLSEHSLTFQEKMPFYAGHPNESDLEAIKNFGEEISIRLKNPSGIRFNPIAFKDKPALLNFIDDHINKIENFTWAMPRVKINAKACAGCGLCVKNCPTNNITVDRTALHGNRCTYCYGCLRICPVGAIKAFLKPAAPTVRFLAKVFAQFEEQVTQQVV